jgi:predicted ATPase/DNA-binding winged helix-turn-helix (wHTH) protein
MTEMIDKIFRIGRYTLDLRRGCLRCEDRDVALRPKSFDVLCYLVQNAGRLVSKDELIEAVWSNVVVTDDSLTRCICDVRGVLQDTSQLVIKTVQRRGYLLTAAVSIEAHSGIEPQRARPAPAIPPAQPDPVRSRNNLPQCLAAMIGRDTELAELQHTVATNRLVTLAGPSGIGKTRLAVELGWRMLPLFADGVWQIDLAPLSDPAVVTSAVATVLDVALTGTDSAVETIAAAIGKRRKLLIFDNCEHLVAAAAGLIGKLLERTPLLSILATSQEVLGIQAEQVYRLNALPLPVPAAAYPKSSVRELADFGAVALFVERARAADRRFALDDSNAASVVEICHRLDGIPLALEMAAARLPLLGIEGLRARLDERLQMLSTGPRTSEARHRTLRDTVAWSHGLLAASEQLVFRRLSAFAGGFSLDAAIAIAGGDTASNWDIVDTLGRLVDKSLVTVEGDERPRYRLLETLRLYAAERLAASGEGAAVAERHARYFTSLFERAFEVWEVTPDTEWLATYQPDIGNVRAALDWTQGDASRSDLAIALAGSAALFWDKLSLVPEGRLYVGRAVRLVDRSTPSAAAARLLRFAGGLWYSSDRQRALAHLERSAAFYCQLGDPANLGSVIGTIGGLYAFVGRHEAAEAVLCEAERILSPTRREKSLFNVMNSRGSLALIQHDPAKAQGYFSRALDLARAQKDAVREGQVLANLAEVEFGLGAVDRAVERGTEAVSRLRSVDRRSYLGWALVNLASYLIAGDSLSEARSIAAEALSLVRDEGGFIVLVCLQQWALLGALDGRHRAAAQLIGFVDAGLSRAGEIRQPTEQQIYQHLSRLLADGLPAVDRDALRDEGARWGEAEAVTFALNHLIR